MKFSFLAAMAFFSPTKVQSKQIVEQYMVDCGQTREAEVLVQSLTVSMLSTDNTDTNALKKSGICIVDLTSDQAQALRETDGVEFVESDSIVTLLPVIEEKDEVETSEVDEVPYGIKMVQADQLWNKIVPEEDKVTVCVVDTGYGLGHPDLPNSEDHGVRGFSPYGGDELWDVDVKNHGTHCAGIIGAIGNNSKGVQGVNNNPDNFNFFIAKGLRNSGTGSMQNVQVGIQKCVDNGAKIVSLSLGSVSSNNAHETFFKNLVDQNILIIAASGNTGKEEDFFPASYPHIMSVGAVRDNKKLATFTTTNSQIEISAPGYKIKSTVTGNNGMSFDYARQSGTSMACPHVAGVAAALWSYFPTCTNIQIRNVLNRSAENVIDQRDKVIPIRCNSQFGHGIVQLKDAYDMIDAEGCRAGGETPAGIPLSEYSIGGCEQVPKCDIYGDLFVMVQITTDGYSASEENRWEIVDGDGVVVMSGGPFLNEDNSKVITPVQSCLTNNQYVFTIYDKYGDGLDCTEGLCAKFEVLVDGVTVISGSKFGFTYTRTFPKTYPTASPTPRPTTSQPTPLPTMSCGDSGGLLVIVEISTDDYGAETSWNISTSLGEKIMSGGPFPDENNSVIKPVRACLPNDQYTFAIFDSFGDGICNGIAGGCGSYKVLVNDETAIVGGGSEESDFENEFAAIFTSPTSYPTKSPNSFPICDDGDDSGEFLVTVEISTDEGGNETSWIISTLSGENVISSGIFLKNSVINPVHECLPSTQYIFELFDSYGDGICSCYGDGICSITCGSYKVLLNNEVVVAGGGTEERNFEDKISVIFPKSPSTISPTPAPICEDSYFRVTVEIVTDHYAVVDQTSWDIISLSDNEKVMVGGEYKNNEEYLVSKCLKDENYRFTIHDNHGDGICNDERTCGSIKVLVNNNELISVGGSFENDFKFNFTETFPESSSTNAPTKSPTNSPTDSPTNPPTISPTNPPTISPTNPPTSFPTNPPTNSPTNSPTSPPTNSPTNPPTNSPTKSPTSPPTNSPTTSTTVVECEDKPFFNCEWVDEKKKSDNFKQVCKEVHTKTKNISSCKANFKKLHALCSLLK